MVEMPCKTKKKKKKKKKKKNNFFHCACASDLHGNMVYVIKTLNSVCLSLFLDMFPPPPTLDPRWPFVNEMSPHIYTTYVSGILGLGGEQGCWCQRRQHTTENFIILVENTRFRNIPRHQLYKYIKWLVVGVVEQLFTLLYLCFTHA